MIETSADYIYALYCIECKFGAKVTKYINSLRLGIDCSVKQKTLEEISIALAILKCYDTRDIALDDTYWNTFTLAEMSCLIEIVNLKLA